ncbi:TIGR01212 family radical SAM protein [Desulfosporosinus shakirovi]|uniref:TIGR01212 family radical SAM protein n=1 Tax=Desulfosporosinus shakirovi TaxID=2885154 RepID=UPI001E62C973|nr:TIGR01212 family radical SAM protein [Desulfosporosinus sp. SRJS8]MCB8817029.1 TIGR01212 family radical SAM protein [Desulfosporosinus sp. SRJS8]
MQKKRYLTFNEHLRNRFREKVFKVSLDAGFTCPNRDGTLGWSGCVYCSERGSGDFAGDQKLPLHDQFVEVSERMKRKWPSAKYIAYFQAYTNTYASPERLREVYEEALAEENVIGLSVSTRPDCLPEDVLDYLEELNRQTYLWVELGLQSSHDRTMEWIRRGHDYSRFLKGLEQLRSRGIQVCAHIILGLPGESKAEMLETARAVAGLPIQGIKIHLLHVLRGTPLATIYESKPFELMTKEDYVSLVVDILEILPPEMVIHRLTGDGPPDDLIGPLWSRKKWEVLNAIDAELELRDTWQGKRAEK